MLFLLVAVMFLVMPLTTFAADEVTLADIGLAKSDIVVFYTNDVHGGVSDRNMIHGTSENCLLVPVKPEFWVKQKVWLARYCSSMRVTYTGFLP